MHKRSRHVVTGPDVPRLEDGGVALCHTHQRAVVLAKGLNRYLASKLRHAAEHALATMPNPCCPKCGFDRPYKSRPSDASRYRYVCRNALCRKRFGMNGEPKRPLPPDVLEKIETLVRTSGYPDWRIAAELGIHHYTVRRTRIELAERTADRPKAVTP
jgi:transposase-like protein